MNVPATFSLIPKFSNMLWQKMRQVYEQVALALNGNISFGQVIASGNLILGAAASRSQSTNIDGVWMYVQTGLANVDFTITHNLGRPASGFIVMQKAAEVEIYNSISANPNPTTQSILRSTVSNIDIILFVI